MKFKVGDVIHHRDEDKRSIDYTVEAIVCGRYVVSWFSIYDLIRKLSVLETDATEKFYSLKPIEVLVGQKWNNIPYKVTIINVFIYGKEEYAVYVHTDPISTRPEEFPSVIRTRLIKADWTLSK